MSLLLNNTQLILFTTQQIDNDLNHPLVSLVKDVVGKELDEIFPSNFPRNAPAELPRIIINAKKNEYQILLCHDRVVINFIAGDKKFGNKPSTYEDLLNSTKKYTFEIFTNMVNANNTIIGCGYIISSLIVDEPSPAIIFNKLFNTASESVIKDASNWTFVNGKIAINDSVINSNRRVFNQQVTIANEFVIIPNQIVVKVDYDLNTRNNAISESNDLEGIKKYIEEQNKIYIDNLLSIQSK